MPATTPLPRSSRPRPTGRPWPRTSRQRPAVLAAAVVFAGVAVVAVASRGGLGERTDAAFEAGPPVARALGVIVAIVALLSIAVFVWALWPDDEAAPRTVRPNKKQNYIGLALVGIAILIAVSRGQRAEPEVAPAGGGTTGAQTPPGDEGAGEGRASATGSIVAVAVAAGGLVTVMALTRRRPAEDALTAEAEDEATPLTESALAERASLGLGAVHDEPDPRTAILLAYATLEHHLSGTPRARRAASSPQEWVGVVAASGQPGLTAAHRRLTTLYERVRFGTGVPTPADRADAVEALERAMAVERETTA